MTEDGEMSGHDDKGGGEQMGPRTADPVISEEDTHVDTDEDGDADEDVDDLEVDEDADSDEGADSDEDENDDVIPSPLYRAMKDRMRSRRLTEPEDAGFLRCRLGLGDEAVYFMDDGPERCVVGRLVGRAQDGCTYCLVAPIAASHFSLMESGDVPLEEAFAPSRDIALCSVFEDEMGGANLFVVEHFQRFDNVPEDYRPPSPFIEFSDEDQPGEY